MPLYGNNSSYKIGTQTMQKDGVHMEKESKQTLDFYELFKTKGWDLNALEKIMEDDEIILPPEQRSE